MNSVFPSCLALSALSFHREADKWSPRTRFSALDAEWGGGSFEPSSIAVKLAEDVLPQTETLRQIAMRYLDLYVDLNGFTEVGEWSVESLEFDLPPLLADDQFTLCLRHPGDPRGLWRVIFRRLPADEAAMLGEEAAPLAVHREQRRLG